MKKCMQKLNMQKKRDGRRYSLNVICPKAFFDGYDRKAALKNYEGITVQFKMSGMYLTVQPTEEGYKYLVYDQELHEISGDACGIQKILFRKQCMPV